MRLVQFYLIFYTKLRQVKVKSVMAFGLATTGSALAFTFFVCCWICLLTIFIGGCFVSKFCFENDGFGLSLLNYLYKNNYTTVRCNFFSLMLRNCSILLVSSCFEWVPWQNYGMALTCSFFTVSKTSDIFLFRAKLSKLKKFSVKTHGAHNTLGTLIWLFIPAYVHLYMYTWTLFVLL